MLKNRKATLITVFTAAVVVISVFYLAVLAATNDFTANGNVTVDDVTFGGTTADLFIQSGSEAESWSYSGGAFTVSNVGTSFAVGSTDSAVKTIVASTGGTAVACGENSTPGTSVVSLPTTANTTYTVEPSTTTACISLCTSLTGAASYNAFPTCGAASCSNGYVLSGTGATATCSLSGGGGGGGGGGGSSGSAVTTTTTTTTTGSTTSYSNGSLLRASDSDKVYLIDDSKKRWIPSGEIFTANGYSWSNVKVVDPSVVSKYTEGSNVSSGSAATPSSSDTSSIAEGALIRAKGDVDVYIVKYVGSKKFKRLVLSPSVFKSYGHLKWSDVKEVDQSVADAFTTSDLVRAVKDPKVYKLYPSGDTGEKRWVTTAEAFTRLGFDWDAIYEINSFDRDSYKTGSSLQ